jgi:hypothetical protein
MEKGQGRPDSMLVPHEQLKRSLVKLVQSIKKNTVKKETADAGTSVSCAGVVV